jgi:cytidylate kinase
MKKKIITISREFGSAGRYIGQEVAKELGIAYYDSKLVNQIADKTGFDKEFIAENCEFAPDKKGYFFNLSQAGMAGTGALSLYDQIYICQHNIITDLAEKEAFVIVGRCADYILRERKDVLHFFIHADMKSRMKRITEEYGIEDERPEKRLNEMDEKRATYYKNYTLRDWGDKANYDAMLNSETLGVQSCVEIITSLYRKNNH